MKPEMIAIIVVIGAILVGLGLWLAWPTLFPESTPTTKPTTSGTNYNFGSGFTPGYNTGSDDTQPLNLYNPFSLTQTTNTGGKILKSVNFSIAELDGTIYPSADGSSLEWISPTYTDTTLNSADLKTDFVGKKGSFYQLTSTITSNAVTAVQLLLKDQKFVQDDPSMDVTQQDNYFIPARASSLDIILNFRPNTDTPKNLALTFGLRGLSETQNTISITVKNLVVTEIFKPVPGGAPTPGSKGIGGSALSGAQQTIRALFPRIIPGYVYISSLDGKTCLQVPQNNTIKENAQKTKYCDANLAKFGSLPAKTLTNDQLKYFMWNIVTAEPGKVLLRSAVGSDTTSGVKCDKSDISVNRDLTTPYLYLNPALTTDSVPWKIKTALCILNKNSDESYSIQSLYRSTATPGTFSDQATNSYLSSARLMENTITNTSKFYILG